MKIQPLSIEIPDNTATGAALPNVNRVFTWLSDRGWNCTRPSVHRHAAKGLIRRNAAGEFELSDVLDYARNHWRIVNPALAVPEAPAASDGEAHPVALPVEIGFEPGLDPAVDRLRQAEVMAFHRWNKAVADGNAPEAVFRSYSQAVELLRKAEKNLLDLQVQRRDLLPKSEVRTWMLRQIVSAKSTLLNLPGKLSPSLEGLPWPRIQQRLEEEILHALGKLSSDPDAPVGGGLEAPSHVEPVAVGGVEP
ncbi:MAG: hypothetical protein EOM10_13570 [Opitutae bacterium]|nr:hypothetical protein [Opitutae bacterium]